MNTQAPFRQIPNCLQTDGKKLFAFFCFLGVFGVQVQAAKIFEYFASDWPGPSNNWISRTPSGSVTNGQILFWDNFKAPNAPVASAPQKGSSTIAGVSFGTAVFNGNDFFTSTFTNSTYTNYPWAGLKEFSLSLVFKSSSPLATTTDVNAFWAQRGILGFERGGVGAGEFAISLYNDGSSNGAVAASTGLGTADIGTSAGNINDRNWHTLTMVVKDETGGFFSQTVYVDGTVTGSSLQNYGALGMIATNTFSLGSIRGGSLPGGPNSGLSEKFVGEVAVLRFDDSPLTAAEIPLLHSTYLGILTAPSITSSNTFSGTVGVPLSNNITAAGTTPIAFSATDLPAGLSVTNLAGTNWAITGTPTAAGVFSNAILTATNVAGSNNQAITFTITNSAPNDSSFSGWLGSATPSADLLVQYAYGASNSSTGVSSSNYPSTTFNSNSLVMTYYIRKNSTNSNLVTPQVHTNLADSNGWGPIPSNNIATVGTNNMNGVDVIQKTATVPIDSTTRKFLRLKISE